MTSLEEQVCKQASAPDGCQDSYPWVPPRYPAYGYFQATRNLET